MSIFKGGLCAANEFQAPEKGDVIRFPVVITNSGEYYDPSESIFTCPFNGLYYFAFSLYSTNLNDGEVTAGMIQRDSVVLTEAFCENEGSDHVYVQCVNSVVIPCNEGEQGFMSGFDNSQIHSTDNRNTFSGFLIQPDTSSFQKSQILYT